MTNGIFVSLFNFVSLFMFFILSYVYKTPKMPAHWCIYKLIFLYLFNISEYKAMLIKLLIYHRNIYISYIYVYINIYILFIYK